MQFKVTIKLDFHPMDRGAYNRYKGWEIPKDENPDDRGWLVTFPNGQETWWDESMLNNCKIDKEV